MYSQYPVINHNGEGYKKDILLLLFSCFSCVPLFATPWTGACQAPLSMEFSRQEYWSGLPFPPPGDLTQGSNLWLLHLLHCREILYRWAWKGYTDERLLLNHTKTPGFLASGGEEFNPGPETRLDRSELLCNKVLLKYKGDRESFWHRHQKGVERVLACLVLAMELYTLQWIQRMSGGCKDLTRPTPII